MTKAERNERWETKCAEGINEMSDTQKRLFT